MIRRWVLRAFAVVVAVAVGVPALATAMSSPVGVGLTLSADGKNWTEELAAPLFSPDTVWVPGDVRSTSFFVANHGPTAAQVRVALRTSADGLVEPGDVFLDARLVGGRWQRLDSSEDAAVLSELVAVPTDDSRKIDLRATFRPEATNRSQSAEVKLAFVVELSEALTPPVAEELPGTGAPRLWLPGAVGLFFVAIGVFLIRRESATRDG